MGANETVDVTETKEAKKGEEKTEEKVEMDVE
jgi:hypothetical protein